MSGKYAFTQTLKEVRFHFCQTSEPSAAVRYAFTLFPHHPARLLTEDTDHSLPEHILP